MSYAAGVVPKGSRWMRVCTLAPRQIDALAAAKRVLLPNESIGRLFTIALDDAEYHELAERLAAGKECYLCLGVRK